jgi:hypothetical protein
MDACSHIHPVTRLLLFKIIFVDVSTENGKHGIDEPKFI